MIVCTPRRRSPSRPVGRLHLVAELDALYAGLGNQGRRGLQGHADVPDLDPTDLLDGGAGQDRPAGVFVHHVRGEPREVGARILPAPGLVAAVIGMAAAALHPQQLVHALVELVVADTRDVQAHGVERLDSGLVVEQAGEERAAADQVPGGHSLRVPRLGAEPIQGGGEVLRTTDQGAAGVELRARRRPARAVDRARRPARLLQVPMEVVERQHLERELLRRPRTRLGGSGDSGRRHGQCQGGGDRRKSTSQAHRFLPGSVPGPTLERATDRPPEGRHRQVREPAGCARPGRRGRAGARTRWASTRRAGRSSRRRRRRTRRPGPTAPRRSRSPR